MKIADQCVVSFHYTLTSEGNELDSSKGKDPLTYMQGAGNIIPGLEDAMLGREAGDSFNVEIEPAEAYGEMNESLIQKVPLAAFEGVEKVEPGMQFQAAGQDGSTRNIVVVQVEGDEVTVNANHPLAGLTLNFDVSVETVREASAEELGAA